ncbi:cyclic nucleotide-binding domain-containing protein [Methylomicrobium sp. Wu6]|uniref:cyclic nucleotide-binding domain-containing protein n=1 Tax=Methylomicrobium sp. Wu6 TaxID=3107928 RepID=UPI002DD6A74B|nr:cyclic nucleotide-binding domain-containing protein [Methylomicrobium sp. Wu6]MEC4749763.1 cyclic nucleotide-binding domain-containing protein [Methylomicrobium sp. Wu6]
MAIDVNSEDGLRIRKLVPLATLPGPLFNDLCNEMTIEEIRDTSLFKKGDTDNHLFYLIDGEVALQAEGLVIDVISAAHESSKFALAHQLPRKIDAVAKGAVRFIRLDAERVNNPPPLEYKEEKDMMVVEEEIEGNSGDWMTELLKLPIIQRLPPANLQKVLFALEEVVVEKGDTIIEQGAVGDYFYFLKSGQCAVLRRPTPNSKDIRLGVLEKGDIFGEDALITDAPRMVSITALSDVTLLRLNKKQFVSLIKAPSLTFVSYEELLAQQQVGAVVLDIRSPDEFERRHFDGAINVPFFSLRMQFKSMSRDKTVIVVCRDGRSSEAGAFLLLKNRYKAVILKGGMVSILEAEKQEEVKDDVETTAGMPSQMEQEDTFELKEAGVSPEGELQKLKTENEALRRTLRQLNEKYNKLDLEKKQIEDRFAMLSKHFEQLKQMLQKLKNTA